jgi:hypothetical protein
MSNPSPQNIASNIGAVFAQLSQQDIEEFYISYQHWNLQHQIEVLQIKLQDLRKQTIVNTERLQDVQPTAIELATLARLQSNGVSDVDLLDRMLERGESWLDRTMQRLDYLEQLDDFISDDYTQWCHHALEGAYDWIDSVLDGNTPSLSPAAATGEEALTEATEELFLQKISNDETEDESVLLETTMKRPSITLADLEESVPSTEDTPVAVEDAPTSAVHEDITLDSSEDTKTSIIEEPTHTENIVPEEPLTMESSSTSANGHPAMQESVEVLPVTEEPSPTPPKTSLENVSHKRPSFIRRFLAKIWGS